MRTPLYAPVPGDVLNETHPFRESGFLSKESIFLYPPEKDVSIIVPCYNAERFLPGCIASLAAQETGYRYEVILVDDGSKDGTGELIAKAAREDPVFEHMRQENQGAAAARNTGMRHARGEYLLFVDADDVVSPGYVEALMQCVRAAGADLGVCAWYSFTGEDRRYKNVQWGKDVSTRDLNGTPWGKAFHRKLFEHLLWPAGYWYEDTVLAFLVYPRVEKIAATNACSYGYRSSMQNATHTGRKSDKALDSLYITELTLRGAEEMGLGAWLESREGQERLLNQFYLNQRRIQRLPRPCRNEVFRLQSACARRMALKAECDSPLYALALRKGSPALGEAAVRLEKAGKAMRLLCRKERKA